MRRQGKEESRGGERRSSSLGALRRFGDKASSSYPPPPIITSQLRRSGYWCRIHSLPAGLLSFDKLPIHLLMRSSPAEDRAAPSRSSRGGQHLQTPRRVSREHRAETPHLNRRARLPCSTNLSRVMSAARGSGTATAASSSRRVGVMPKL